MSEYCVVHTTFSAQEEAQRTIEAVLAARLAACAQSMEIASRYIWKGEVCREREILVLFKTTWARYEALEAKIRELHSYETPEIIAVDIERGSKSYLEWLDENAR